MRSRLSLILCVLSLSAALAGCSGSEGGATTPPPASNNPPPPLPPPPAPPPPPPVIGADGGTVTEASGASLEFPAGAVTTDTTFRIAVDSTGAPVTPEGMTTAGNVYVVTPHGGNFAKEVEVSIPAPAVSLQTDQLFKIAKAEPDGEWVILNDTKLVDGKLVTAVRSFSFFRVVKVTFPHSLVSIDPLEFTTTLTCDGGPCNDLVGNVNASYTALSNNGQMPATCDANSLFIGRSEQVPGHSTFSRGFIRTPITPAGGARNEILTNPDHNLGSQYQYGIGMLCGSVLTDFGSSTTRWALWAQMPEYPNLSVLRTPAQIDAVEGASTVLKVILSGGAAGSRVERADPQHAEYLVDPVVPTLDDRAIVEWLRSDNEGASWRYIATSFQDDGDPLPFGTGAPWRPWSVHHDFIASAADQGALLRVRACYTPIVPGIIRYDAPLCVTGPATRLNVLQQSAPPAIVSGPRSVLIRTGQTASLSVTATGLPAPTLQWQTRPANSQDAWSNVTTGSGATTANYTTAPLALSENGRQYRVIATNSMGSVESIAISVSVSDVDIAPSITTQPAHLAVTAGSDAVFAVDARGAEALSYQWRFNGAPIAGANSPVLRLTGVTNANAGAYTVTVSNTAGDADSNTAVLTVSPGAPPAAAPTIVTQPAAVTVNVGNTATFAVGVDGSGPFTFQWRRDGVAIPGATAAVLTLNSVAASDAANYSVLVSNAASATGVASDAAVLTVLANGAATPPSITTQPATLIVAPGGSGMLAVAATGSGPLSYEWLRDGAPISGATSAVLLFDNVDESAAGRYAVRVSNSLGSVVSAEVELILLGAPEITTQPSSLSTPENNPVTFAVGASGSGIRYQWLRNGFEIAGATQPTYTTPMLTVADSGAVYTVIVFNSAGVSISQPAVLTVYAPVPPTVQQQPADVSVQAGALANLCMAFGGTPPFSVRMNRLVADVWTPVGGSITFTDNSPTCISTPNLQLVDNGAQFVFFASNAEGGVFEAMTRTVTVTVTAPPAVTVTTLASRATSGATANNRSFVPSISADGNLVAFISQGTNLVPGFTNPPTEGGHAYVRNLTTGVTTAINQTPAGAQSSRGVVDLKLAAGGRYAVFSSLAGDLVADDTNGSQDVFVRDLQTGVTERINVRANGSEITDAGNGQSDMHVDISADGRYVSYHYHYDLIGSDPPDGIRIYLRDMQSDQTRLVAVSSPSIAFGYSALASGGEYLAYTSTSFAAPARGIVTYYEVESGDAATLFTFDTSNGVDYLGQGLSISGDGRYVALAMRSAPLLGSTAPQVVAIDTLSPDTLILASTGSADSGIGVGDAASSFPKLSDDGRYVLYATNAANLSANIAIGGRQALMIRDLQTQTTAIASRRQDGAPVRTAPGLVGGHTLSGDGAILALTADDFEMTGGAGETQVYAAPRP